MNADLPLAWETREVLRHSFQVCTSAWTHSGDGLMVAGSEIIVWQHQAGNMRDWIRKWRVNVEKPQHLCAATSSVTGFVASANGVPAHEIGSLEVCVNPDDRKQSSSKDRATIWSWEAGLGVEEVELMHPQQVLMLQWRPSKATVGNIDQELHEVQRPILLTACSDGAVRLWMEVDSGRSRLDRAAGKESAEKRLKTAFFVSAVIEVNRTLYGQLGQNVFVMWATDIVVKAFGATSIDSGGSQAYKRKDVAPCEWLVGMGPDGSISLWSLHCLDDISPPRCPRVLLWEHGFNLVPNYTEPSFLKVVVRRPEGTMAEPPSCLDIFEFLQGGHFRWLRIWPPVSAIGRGGSKVPVLSSETPSTSLPSSPFSPGKKSAWSVACEDLKIHGHSDEILNIAVHPCIFTQLAASVDMTGTVIVWLLGSCYGPQFQIENFSAPFLKFGGQLSGHQIPRDMYLDLLAWAPVVFPDGGTCLMAVDSDKVSCFYLTKEVVSLKPKSESVKVLTEHIFDLPWPVSAGQSLQGIYIVSTANAWIGNGQQTKCTLLGIGNNGTLMVSWQLSFCVSPDDDATTQLDQIGVHSEDIHQCKRLRILSDHTGPPIALQVSWHVMSSVSLEFVQRVISVASPAPWCASMDADNPGRHVNTSQFVTGCADGIVRIWQVVSQKCCVDEESEKTLFQCMGLLKAGDEQITSVSMASSAGRLATSCTLKTQSCHSVSIWQAESLNSHGRYRLVDEVLLPSVVLALSWFEEGSGRSVLAVALQNKVEIYGQLGITSSKPSEKRLPRLDGWICITSAVLDCRPDTVAWGPCGTLLLASGCRILVSGLRTSSRSKQTSWNKEVSRLGSTSSSSSPSLSTYTGVHSSGKVEEVIVRASSYNTLLDASNENMSSERVQDTLGILSESVQTCLSDYHPKKILWYLSKGILPTCCRCVGYL